MSRRRNISKKPKKRTKCCRMRRSDRLTISLAMPELTPQLVRVVQALRVLAMFSAISSAISSAVAVAVAVAGVVVQAVVRICNTHWSCRWKMPSTGRNPVFAFPRKYAARVVADQGLGRAPHPALAPLVLDRAKFVCSRVFSRSSRPVQIAAGEAR